MRGKNDFDRAPVRLNVGGEKDRGQDRRQHPIPGISSNGQILNYGGNPGLREAPRRKGLLNLKQHTPINH